MQIQRLPDERQHAEHEGRMGHWALSEVEAFGGKERLSNRSMPSEGRAAGVPLSCTIHARAWLFSSHRCAPQLQ